MKYVIVSIILLFAFNSSIIGQQADTTKIVTIELKNKDFFSGELVEITADSIVVLTEDLELVELSKSEIKSIREGILSPFFTATTNSSVPFFVQTALPNGNGNHYYKNYYIFGNEFNFGLSDNFNASIGFETGSLIFDDGNSLPLIQLGAKQSFPISESFSTAISVKYYFNDNGSVYMVDMPLTLGNSSSNITLSPNITFADGSRYFSPFANLSLGLSLRSRFVIDYARLDEVSVAAILYEYTFKSGFALSVGAFVADGGAVPNLSFSIPFGRWKH